MKRITPDNKNLQYSGRIDFDNPKAPVFVYACTYVKMVFTGTKLKVFLENHHSYWKNEMGYILDGQQGKFALCEEKGEVCYTIADQLPEGEHEILLFKRMDACHYVTFYGFSIAKDANVYTALAKPARRVEVYGDSVSCGEVSEALSYVGKSDPVHNGEFSNSWYSYAWMVARKLNAELHDISQGGIALLDKTGWFAAPDYKGMESCYDKIEYHPDLGAVKKWDFSQYTPQVVIVAIGQNDNHPIDYMAEDYKDKKAVCWREHYRKFVERLMEVYPKTQIILTTTILEHHSNWDVSIDEVCNQINSTRVHHFMYKRNGCGTPGHLRIPEAEEMAEELYCYISSLGDEIWM